MKGASSSKSETMGGHGMQEPAIQNDGEAQQQAGDFLSIHHASIRSRWMTSSGVDG